MDFGCIFVIEICGASNYQNGCFRTSDHIVGGNKFGHARASWCSERSALIPSSPMNVMEDCLLDSTNPLRQLPIAYHESRAHVDDYIGIVAVDTMVMIYSSNHIHPIGCWSHTMLSRRWMRMSSPILWLLTQSIFNGTNRDRTFQRLCSFPTRWWH